MVFKWKEEHTPRFLEHFKKYGCLWDFRKDGYKNREIRAQATKSLIKDLNLDGVTEEDIKLKTKSIRTRYTCELSKIKRSIQSGCSQEDIYVPKLFWFRQADEFLNAVCMPRDTSSNFSISEYDLQVTIKENIEEEGLATSQAKDPLTDTPRLLKHRKRSSDTPVEGEAKRKISASQPPENHQLPMQHNITSDYNNKGTTENEFDLFCRSLAVQLKNMPLHRALICQQDLLAVMVQERLQSLSRSPPTHPSYNSVDR